MNDISKLTIEEQKTYQIFKEIFDIEGDDSFIPANATLLNDIPTEVIYSLISKNILQKRECEGTAYEFTNKEKCNLLESEINNIDFFYKKICESYCNTMSKELLIEDYINNKIHHIFVEDKYINLAEDGKINLDNYKKYLDHNFGEDLNEGEYLYNSYKDLYENYVRDEIYADIQDLGLYDDLGNWDFEISKEDLTQLNKLGEHFDIYEPDIIKSEEEDEI